MGNIEQNLARQAIRANRPLPDRILNAPVLKLGLDFFIKAFFELETDRDFSFCMGPLKWTTIHKYGEFYNLDTIQFEKLHLYLTRMDHEYCKLKNKEQNG